jgi:hypothetical protein
LKEKTKFQTKLASLESDYEEMKVRFEKHFFENEILHLNS